MRTNFIYNEKYFLISSIMIAYWLFSCLIIYLFKAKISAEEYVKNSQCLSSTTTVFALGQSYGSMNSFYDIAQGISRRMQANLTDGSLEIASRIYRNLSNSVYIFSDDTSYLITKQTGAIIFLVIGLLFIIGLPTSGLIFCCCRLCDDRGGKKCLVRPSKAISFISTLFLLVSCAFITTGMLLYGMSVRDSVKTIDEIDSPADIIVRDIRRVLTDAEKDISCHSKETFTTLFSNVERVISGLPERLFEAFEEKLQERKSSMRLVIIGENDEIKKQLDKVNSKIMSAEKKLKNLMGISNGRPDAKAKVNAYLSALNLAKEAVKTAKQNYEMLYKKTNEVFEKAKKSMDTFKEKINSAIKNAAEDLKNAREKVSDLLSSISKTASQIDSLIINANEMLKQFHKSVKDFPRKRAVIDGIYATVIIPCMAVLIPAVIVAFCGMCRLTVRNKKLPERTAVCNCGGHVAMLGITTAFLLGWVVMVIASIGFFGGYTIETLCGSLFRDDQMRIFNHFDELFNFSVPSPIDGSSITLKFGEVMKECRVNQTLFTALKGDQFVNVNAILQNANLENAKTKALRTFKDEIPAYFFEANFKEIKGSENYNQNITLDLGMPEGAIDNGAVTKEVDQLLAAISHQFNELKRYLSKMIKHVRTLENKTKISKDFKEDAMSVIEKQFNDAKKNIAENLKAAKNELVHKTYQCRPIYNIWQNVGVLFCENFGRPIQGIWASSGLAAISFIPLIIMLMLISKYLFCMDKKYEKNENGKIPTMNTICAGIYAYESSPQGSTVPLVFSNAASPLYLPYLNSHSATDRDNLNAYGHCDYSFDANCDRTPTHRSRTQSRISDDSPPSLYSFNNDSQYSDENYYSPSSYREKLKTGLRRIK